MTKAHDRIVSIILDIFDEFPEYNGFRNFFFGIVNNIPADKMQKLDNKIKRRYTT